MDYKIEYIDEFEVLRYLGFKNFRAGDRKRGNAGSDTSAEVAATLEEVGVLAEEVKRIARPKGIYQRVPLTKREGEYYLLDGGLHLPGKSIKNHLKESREVILITGTLGISIDQYLRSSQLTDMKKAVICDSIASVAIENILDQVQAQIRQTLAEGEFLTDRFAPGYGDLPLELNGLLAGLLDTKRGIGLTVSSSGIMIPRKSILAILGVAGNAQPQFARGCAVCAMKEDCNYNKAGELCKTIN